VLWVQRLILVTTRARAFGGELGAEGGDFGEGGAEIGEKWSEYGGIADPLDRVDLFRCKGHDHHQRSSQRVGS
jgi:hypothetical protein